MKKYIILVLLLIVPLNVFARNDKIEVTLNKCVDGDTAWFNYNNEKMKTRFLAIDTPESTTTIEPYGKEASKYTCDELSNADKIVLEFDGNSDELDKYNRYLVWVFVDDELLQEKIIENGFAEVKYLYGDYKYTSILKEKENNAKNNNIGMWANLEKSENNYNILVIIGCCILLLIFTLISKKSKNKNIRKLSNRLKKNSKKKLDSLLK